MENKYYQVKNFTFVGKLKSIDNLIQTKEGKRFLRLSLPIFDGVSTAYAECFSFGLSDHIYTTVNKKFEKINWADRNSSRVLKGMNYNNVYRLDLKEKKEFSNSYDLIKGFEELINEGFVTKDMRLKVIGDVEFQYYNGEVKPHYNIKSISLPDKNIKDSLIIVESLLVEKDSIKETDNGLEIDGYVVEYMKLDNESKKYPRLIEQHLIYPTDNKMVKKLMLDKLNIKEGYVAACFEINLFRSAKEATVQPLTDEQKLFVELGFISEEEALKDNTIIDDHVTEELRVVKPVVKKQFKDIVFIPNQEQTKEYVKGFEPKVENMFNVFGESSIEDSDLDDFFNSDDLPF